MSVLVIGEALIDESHGTDGRTTRSVGGSPINVAIALGRLGTPVTLLTDIGDDPDGEWISRHAETSGVRLDAKPEGATSIARARLQPDGAATYEFQIRWNPAPRTLPTPHTLIHTGSLALFLDPGARLVVELLHRDPLAIVSIDPNIRPGIIGDHHRAVHRFETIASVADIVKLSDEDARWLYPDTAIADIPPRIAALGPAVVVMTTGADGAVLQTAAATIHLPGLRVPVADTIGAGDTFMGAFLHRLLELGMTRDQLRTNLTSEHLNQIGHFAIHAAAINVTRHGADPPTTADIAAFPARDIPHDRA